MRPSRPAANVAAPLSFIAVLLFAVSPALPRHAVLGAGVADRQGVRVSFIRPGSAAERAGLKAGDSIDSIGTTEVHNAAEFVRIVKEEPAGKPIEFHIRRGENAITLPIVLDPAPDEDDPLVDTHYEAVTVDGTLRRTLLTVPKKAAGRRPAVLIIGGIGCYSIDVATDPQDAYLRLTHDLGRAGFVAMRLEKSGIGDSQGPPCMTIDLVHEMESYEAALRALRDDPHVDSGSVYLFGHSIGTLIAPHIAARVPVSGVIIAEGVGRNWVEYELWNLRRQLVLDGQPPAKVDATLSVKEICMHRLLVEKQAEDEIERTQPECKEHNQYPAPAAYMQQAAALNIAEPWTNFSLPLLAIYGSGDFVTAEADHRRIVDIVNANHRGAATLKIIDGMDHHLDVAGTQQQAWELRVKQQKSGPYDEELSAAVVAWLRERVSGPRVAAPGGSPD